MFMLVATSLVTEGTSFIPFDIRNGSLLYFCYACILLSHQDFFLFEICNSRISCFLSLFSANVQKPIMVFLVFRF